MTLNAVQTYIADQLDGLTTGLFAQYDIQPVRAVVMPPPTSEIAEAPHVFVWGASGDENRLTIPRGLGEKRTDQEPVLYVQWITDNETATNPSTSRMFPVLIDAILAKLRSLDLKVNIVDPDTGEVSYLSDIGERLRWSYSTPRAARNQRGLVHNCLIRVPCKELFKG